MTTIGSPSTIRAAELVNWLAMPKSTMDPRDRWWQRVQITEGCWLWRMRPNSDGYGHIKVKGKSIKAHRFGYEMLVGPIPEGLTIDHLCRNRMCVNPNHLEAVTNRENVLRGMGRIANQARQTHCIHGHPFSGENLYISPKSGQRHCRICTRANWTRSYARRQASRNP